MTLVQKYFDDEWTLVLVLSSGGCMSEEKNSTEFSHIEVYKSAREDELATLRKIINWQGS